MPRLSVVVPTYQRCAMLARTLPTILNQVVPDVDFEVVVVVDGSTDGTLEMLARDFADRPVRVLSHANAGPAAARNAGIHAARGSIVLLLDDDIICPPGLLAAHLDAHQGQPPRVVFGPVLGAAGTSTAAELTRLALADYYARMRDEWRPVSAPRVYTAPNTSLPAGALREAGGFDVRFARALEDADLALRLRAAGGPFVYLPEAPVYQLQSKDAQALVGSDAVFEGLGEILLCRRHPEQRRHSFLAGLAKGGTLERWARAALIRSPLAPDRLLGPVFEVVDMAPANWLARHRLWLLSRRSHVARMRAARGAAGGWQNLQAEFGKTCAALLYHHVGPARAGWPATLSVAPDRFERQMRYLHARGFTAITAGRWLEWCETGRPLPAKPFILTFDDGYADLAEHAFPVLRRCGFEATVFIVTGQMGGTNDWDLARGFPRVPLLAREQISTWSRSGIEFGGHSRSHARLDTLSADAVDGEVGGCRADLEALLGEPVRTFAYPYGVAPPVATRAAAETYRLSFGCQEGLNTLQTWPHAQHRTMVQPSDSLLDLEFRARLGWSPLHRARQWLRLRTRIRALGRFHRRLRAKSASR